MATDRYPPHLRERGRRGVAEDLLRHEFKKLGVADFDSQRQRLSNIGTKDFWNLVDAIVCSYKIKDIIRWISAENVTWDTGPLGIMKLTFTAQFDELGGIEMCGRTVSDLKHDLDRRPEIRTAFANRVRSEYLGGLLRADDPIVVVQEAAGRFVVYDGNGRTCLALVNEVDQVAAHLGKQTTEDIQNPWVPTRILSDLAGLKERPSGAKGYLPQVIADVIGTSQSGLQDFLAFKHATDELKQQVHKLLGF